MKNTKILISLGLILFSFTLLAQQWTIEKCVSYAMENNKKILAAEQSVESRRYSKKSAVAKLFPQITASAGVDHYWEIPVQVLPGELIGQSEGSFVPVRMGTPWMGDYGVEARLQLLDPQTWQEVKLASLQHQAFQSESQSLQHFLVKNVQMAFYRAQQQEHNWEIAFQQLENYSEINRLIALQYDKGLIDKILYNQSLSILKERENALLLADLGRQKAVIDLKYWMGYPLQDSIAIEEKSEVLRLDVSNVFEATLLPDYTVQKLRIDLAEQEYRSSISQLYPSLNFTAAYRKLGFGSSTDFIGQEEWFSSGFVGLRLSLPILSLNKMAYNPKMQKAEIQIARLDFASYLEEQKQRFMHEKLQMQDAWKSVLLRRANLQLAEENERLSSQKIQQGLIDMIQLKQIQEDLSAAQEKLNRAEMDFLRHYVELNYLQNK